MNNENLKDTTDENEELKVLIKNIKEYLKKVHKNQNKILNLFCDHEKLI
ncbi:hypothetical protein PFUGPA_04084 [Plasmodium falciparum Palo Alto/Uganda]|uniref:Uncharacterized protein n=3 Tax=Plasmodium falciparum TaxID=5833 RepID=W4IWM8_PLAFP|nr:hypothetical protein PFMALIP_05386 [Plasmodium falciparum MaliPS096_E11]ETW54214.1 hypothetical protein PFUGPA_04084 [Plasmodium falciparum Palo Alto/Uganda]ETW58526.1 hypothetical protein PFMC_05624 [Plasmodium falciparum CAMP/Malaysia]